MHSAKLFYKDKLLSLLITLNVEASLTCKELIAFPLEIRVTDCLDSIANADCKSLVQRKVLFFFSCRCQTSSFEVKLKVPNFVLL